LLGNRVNGLIRISNSHRKRFVFNF